MFLIQNTNMMQIQYYTKGREKMSRIENPNLEKFKIKLKCIKHRLFGERIKYYSPKEIVKKLEHSNFKGVLENLNSDKYIYIGRKIITRI